MKHLTWLRLVCAKVRVGGGSKREGVWVWLCIKRFAPQRAGSVSVTACNILIQPVTTFKSWYSLLCLHSWSWQIEPDYDGANVATNIRYFTSLHLLIWMSSVADLNRKNMSRSCCYCFSLKSGCQLAIVISGVRQVRIKSL